MTPTKRTPRSVSKTPWYTNYSCAKERCERKTHPNFKRYGGRGIKFLMTVDDFGTLWVRDKAHKLLKPSIDRINNDGNYTLSNCRFIEMKENRKRVVRDYSSIMKPIAQINKVSGEVIKVWSSASEASKELGIGFRNISMCLRRSLYLKR